MFNFSQHCDYNLPTAASLKTEADMYVDMINNTYLNEPLKDQVSALQQTPVKSDDEV